MPPCVRSGVDHRTDVVADMDEGTVPNTTLKRLFKVLASAPLLTALGYSFGVSYAFGFYGRIGLDNLDLLGFGVQTYLTRSFAAFTVLQNEITAQGALLGLVALVALYAIADADRGDGVILLGAAIGLVGVTTLSEVERALTTSVAIVIVTLQVGRHQGKVGSVVMPLAGALLVWLALLAGANAAGEVQACRIGAGDDFSSPLLIIVSQGQPYISSRQTPARQISGESDRYQLSNLRLFNTAPAGLLVYPDDGPPDRLIFLPTEALVSVTTIPDGGNIGATRSNQLCQ